MKDDDALANNPHVSLGALEAVHSQLFSWALTRCGFDRSAAEDLMQDAYVAVPSGMARFDNKSSLKTFLFGVVQNLALSRFRRMVARMRLLAGQAAEADRDPAAGPPVDDGAARIVCKLSRHSRRGNAMSWSSSSVGT